MEKIFRNTVTRVLLALLCCALWGSAFPCVKISYEWLEINDAGTQILFAGYRFFLAGVFTFLTACVMERKIVMLQKSSIPYITVQGILQTTIQYVCFYIGLAHTTGTKGSVINSSSAFFSILLAPLVIKGEKVTWKKALGCIVGFVGVIVINMTPQGFGGGFSLVGEGLILMCSFAYGFSTLTLKRISHREKPVTLTAYQLMIGAAVLILIGKCLGAKRIIFAPKSAVLFLYMALLSTIAFSVWTTLIKYNSVGNIAVFGFCIPIFGTALSALALGESVLSVQNLFALLLVCVGVILVNLGPRNRCGEVERKRQV